MTQTLDDSVKTQVHTLDAYPEWLQNRKKGLGITELAATMNSSSVHSLLRYRVVPNHKAS